MKKNIIVLVLMIMVGITVNAKGDVTISSSSLKIKKGEETTFVVKADNIAGRIDIVSSDENIAKIDNNVYFFDTTLGDSKVTITVTGVSEGTTDIKVIYTDVATFDEEEVTGSQIINVVVGEKNNNKSSITPLIILVFTIFAIMIIIIINYKNKHKNKK